MLLLRGFTLELLLSTVTLLLMRVTTKNCKGKKRLILHRFDYEIYKIDLNIVFTYLYFELSCLEIQTSRLSLQFFCIDWNS